MIYAPRTTRAAGHAGLWYRLPGRGIRRAASRYLWVEECTDQECTVSQFLASALASRGTEDLQI